MDLSTKYLGFDLPHPFIPGASVMSEKVDTIKKLEDAGAAAIVLHSLFEEQIVREELATINSMEPESTGFAESLTYFPSPEEFRLGPDEYLAHVSRAKAAIDVPLIASLNGVSLGGWLNYAKLIEQAGADALELNVYYLATEPDETGLSIRERTLEMVREVKQAIAIPVAVKMSPFYTSVAHAAKEMVEAGADGLVLFNRFFQPDIDVEELEVLRALHLSEPSELLLRLRWLAILAGRVEADLAVTGGVHTALDAIKSIMCGADVVQMVSALLLRGPQHLATVRDEVARWMEEHEYESLAQMKGSMSLQRCPDPAAYERANYMHILKSWKAG
ncbi:MAG: dihydroorotate dehydrogenase-like protein [Armatimonadetes bacterium]|nr:dihydroorotate dehydrogenase-like protein [Armatimonadota bacterium]